MISSFLVWSDPVCVLLGQISNFQLCHLDICNFVGILQFIISMTSFLIEGLNKTYLFRVPFVRTIPISMQMCLTSSKKILDGFEVADKKDLTSERMSGIVADTIVRIYDTNLAKLDGLSLKAWWAI